MRWNAIRYTAGLCLAAAASVASAQSANYVLQAGQFGAAQRAAVEAAGGKIRFSHASGMAWVSSDRADFAQAMQATGLFSIAVADQAVQQPAVRVAEQSLDESAVTFPITDSFYPYIQWAPQSVGAPAAWAAGYTGSGVRVAVIDGGVHGTHVDLVGAVDSAAARSFVVPAALDLPVVAACKIAWNCDTGTFWHGTHVAGIVSARANGIGTVGIAPEATIVPVKALHSGSGSFGAIISAILYAATDGRADIINMSLGAVFPRSAPGAAELTSALNKAVNFAGSRGVLVISAAGNDALDIDHTGDLVVAPAQSGNGLAVSATGPLGFALGADNFARPSSYTNYGNSLVSLAGPGGDFALPGSAPCTLAVVPAGTIARPCWVFDMVLSTSRGSGASNANYSWAAGTSMAAPAAAAVAALVKQQNPKISVGALKNRLTNGAIDLGKQGNDPFYGKGFVNAPAALGLQ
jgi:subtilisin family serine protease